MGKVKQPEPPALKKPGIFALLTIPAAALSIAFDQCWRPWGNPFLCVPRSGSEVFFPRWQRWAFNQLRERGVIPKEAVFVAGKPVELEVAEEGKKDCLATMVIEYKLKDGSVNSQSLFLKFPSERKVTLLIRAITSALVAHKAEILFYERIAPTLRKLGVDTPKFFFGNFSRCFYRTCIANEIVSRRQFECIPDWMCCRLDRLEEMMFTIARMHAHFWNSAADNSFLQELTERRGLELFNGLIEMCFNPQTDPSWFKPMWTAIRIQLLKSHVVLCHGDFRPGNVLFVRDSAKDSTNRRMIITDWEALNFLPFMWDFVYSTMLGQEPEKRRVNHDHLLKMYLDALLPRLPENAKPSQEEIENQIALLTVAVHFFGWILERIGGVGRQHGNLDQDYQHWSKRIASAVREVLDPPSKFMTLFDFEVEEKTVIGMIDEVSRTIQNSKV